MITAQRTTEMDADLGRFIEAAAERLSNDPDARLVLTVGEHQFECRRDIADLIVGIVRLASAGQQLELTSTPDILTTGQAAEILGVSRPTVVALVDSGALPASRVGTHRRIKTVDLVDFQAHNAAARRHELSELTKLSADLGLYD
jgi:excisionase family DNA binding protein